MVLVGSLAALHNLVEWNSRCDAGKVENGEGQAKSSRPPLHLCSGIWSPPNLLMGLE